MTTDFAAALLLIAVPVAFNVRFTLPRAIVFLSRHPSSAGGKHPYAFGAGGSRLVMQWWAFALTALLMVPVVVLMSSLFAAGPLRTLAIATGIGVGVGEHLGYLLTGSWTILTGVLILGGALFPACLGWIAIPIGVAQLIGALEFVGPNEPEGWSVAGRIVPVAYIAWSLWLIACGVILLF